MDLTEEFINDMATWVKITIDDLFEKGEIDKNDYMRDWKEW